VQIGALFQEKSNADNHFGILRFSEVRPFHANWYVFSTAASCGGKGLDSGHARVMHELDSDTEDIDWQDLANRTRFDSASFSAAVKRLGSPERLLSWDAVNGEMTTTMDDRHIPPVFDKLDLQDELGMAPSPQRFREAGRLTRKPR
jgi:hypothetical protein